MIPGWIISLVTFPGIIIHEWAHKKFCDWQGVIVHQVRYFGFGNPAGYVLHEKPETYEQTFWVSVGPLLINSVTAIVLSFIASFVDQESIFWLLLIWLAISVGMHSFPSDHDMKHVWEGSKSELKKGSSPVHYLAFPFVALIWLANKLRFFWFDLIYAGLLVVIGGGFY